MGRARTSTMRAGALHGPDSGLVLAQLEQRWTQSAVCLTPTTLASCFPCSSRAALVPGGALPILDHGPTKQRQMQDQEQEQTLTSNNRYEMEELAGARLPFSTAARERGPEGLTMHVRTRPEALDRGCGVKTGDDRPRAAAGDWSFCQTEERS